MGAIVDQRTAIVAKLKAALPGVDIQAHHRSSFSPQDIDRCLTNRAVALRVAFAGVPEDSQLSANDVDTPEAWAVYIMTKDAPPLKRDVLALDLLPVVMRVACENHFATGLISTNPRRVRAAPLYQGEPEESTTSAMCWCVSWLQTVSLPPAANTDIHPLLTLITHYDLAPKDGTDEAADDIEMTS